MSGATALARARQAGVVVTLDGDSLVLSATRPAPKEVLDLLKAYKPDIIRLLRGEDRPAEQVDLTGPSLNPLSPHARAHTCKDEPARVGPVRSILGAGRLAPAGDVALGSDDPGDEGLEWQAEVEEPIGADRIDEELEPQRAHLAPVTGSLVHRLVAAGATVRTWSVGRGGLAEIEAPAGIPADLLHKVDARGWRIIPGGKANPEAEHDSWLAGVPIAEFER